MAITLELEPELEARLARKAEQRGLSVDGYLRDLVNRDTADAPPDDEEARFPPEVAEERMRHMNELVAEWHKLPILDHRSEDEILGWDEFGLPYK